MLGMALPEVGKTEQDNWLPALSIEFQSCACGTGRQSTSGSKGKSYI